MKIKYQSNWKLLSIYSEKNIGHLLLGHPLLRQTVRIEYIHWCLNESVLNVILITICWSHNIQISLYWPAITYWLIRIHPMNFRSLIVVLVTFYFIYMNMCQLVCQCMSSDTQLNTSIRLCSRLSSTDTLSPVQCHSSAIAFVTILYIHPTI